MKLIQITDVHFLNPESICSVTSYGEEKGLYITYTSGGKAFYQIGLEELIEQLETNGVSVARLKRKDEPEIEQMPIDTKLESLNFSVRAEHIFARYKLETIEDLLAYFAHRDKFKVTRGAGEKTISEIVRKMNACGYHFVWE